MSKNNIINFSSDSVSKNRHKENSNNVIEFPFRSTFDIKNHNILGKRLENVSYRLLKIASFINNDIKNSKDKEAMLNSVIVIRKNYNEEVLKELQEIEKNLKNKFIQYSLF